MLRQLLFALCLTCITVMIHAVGMMKVVHRFSGIWRRKTEIGAPVPVMPVIRLVSALLILHLVEMGVWAGSYAVVEIFPDFETSLYFSLTSYTTVGYGDVVPAVSWRLVGPIEAAVGVLMLGWSTGVIVAGLQRLYSRYEAPEPTDKS